MPVSAESPGGRPMGAAGIALITIYLTLVTIVVFHSLVVLWPPNRSAQANDDERIANLVVEKLRATGPATAAEGKTIGEAASETAGESPDEPSGTTEPPGTDLTAEPQGTDLAEEPLRTDVDDSGSGGAASAKEEGQEEGVSKLCADGEQLSAKLFWFRELCLSHEERLFLLVMFAGALGGLVHALRSFFWYAGYRKLVLSWTGFYITLPILGAALATIFYLVIRGGFFSPDSKVSDTSPFGFAALAGLIGMFTEQAAEKLKQIAENLFATAPKGADHAGPPSVSAILPNNGPVAGATEVTITGSGFAQGATVTFGGQNATDVQVASGGTSITAKTPQGAGQGAVTVEVINTGGQKGSLPDGFTYT